MTVGRASLSIFEGLRLDDVRVHVDDDQQRPDSVVFSADTFEVKCAALRAHVSQLGAGEWVEGVLRGWAERDGKRAGLKLAEAFRRMVL